MVNYYIPLSLEIKPFYNFIVFKIQQMYENYAKKLSMKGKGGK